MVIKNVQLEEMVKKYQTENKKLKKSIQYASPKQIGSKLKIPKTARLMNSPFSDEDQIPDESTPEGFTTCNSEPKEEGPLTGLVLTSEFNNSKGEAFKKSQENIINLKNYAKGNSKEYKTPVKEEDPFDDVIIEETIEINSQHISPETDTKNQFFSPESSGPKYENSSEGESREYSDSSYGREEMADKTILTKNTQEEFKGYAEHNPNTHSPVFEYEGSSSIPKRMKTKIVEEGDIHILDLENTPEELIRCQKKKLKGTTKNNKREDLLQSGSKNFNEESIKIGKSIFSSQAHENSSYYYGGENKVPLREASYIPDANSEELNDSIPEVSEFIKKDEDLIKQKEEYAGTSTSYCPQDFSENFSKINSVKR